MRAFDRFAFLIPLLGGALAAGCATPKAPLPVPRPVRVARAEIAAPSGDLRYAATIQPRTQVALAFKVGGYVGEILRVRGDDGASRLLQQGDEVRRGTILARLDAGDFEERVNQAKAQRSESAAGLAHARADDGRAERLYAAQSLTRPEYDAAVASLAVAEARQAAADAQLAAAELVLRDSTLAAPMDAVVLSRGVESGTLAAAGTVAFELADVSTVKAVFGVPDRVVGALAVGEPLTVTVDGIDRVGVVSAIAPSADTRTRVFSVEVTIDNARRALKPGMVASAIVRGEAGREAGAADPTIPLAAIVKSSNGDYAVFVVSGDGDGARARERAVSLGELVGGRISVAKGLAKGEPVVVSGASLLADGEPVRIIP